MNDFSLEHCQMALEDEDDLVDSGESRPKKTQKKSIGMDDSIVKGSGIRRWSIQFQIFR